MPKLHKSLDVFLRTPPPAELPVEAVERALERLGYDLARSEGSHRTWIHHETGEVFGYSIRGGQTVKRWVIAKVAEEIRRQGLG